MLATSTLRPLPANLRASLLARMALRLAFCGIAAYRAPARARGGATTLRPLARIHARTRGTCPQTPQSRRHAVVVRVCGFALPANLPADTRCRRRLPALARAFLSSFETLKKKEEGEVHG